MKRTSAAISIWLLSSTLLAACNPTATPTAVPTATMVLPSPTTQAVVVSTEAPVPSPPVPTPAPTEPIVSQIAIDGNPADWTDYPVLIADPQGDHHGGFDIAAVRAFTNDRYLYVLVETHGARADYVQLDLEIEAGGRRFVVSFNPELGQSAFMGDVTDQFVLIGDVEGSQSVAGEAVEFKMPLAAFPDTTDLRLNNVRPMAGVCCDAEWLVVDEISPVPVPQVGQVEPVSEVVQVPRVCGDDIPPPAPFGSLETAPVEFAQPGYSAEWFVSPSAFNMPQEVMRTPEGNLLVLSTRSQTLFRVEDDDIVVPLATEVWGYQGDVDSQGNVYLHGPSDGSITRIDPNGVTFILAQSLDMGTSCDSGFAIGPDGNLYVAKNLCDTGETEYADLFRISLEGMITRLRERITALSALCTTRDGRLIGGRGDKVYELRLDDYSLHLLASIPGREGLSQGGLTTDEAGNIYISTGSRSPRGQVFRLGADGNLVPMASVPGNGLSGIEWLPETQEIIGAQLQLGGLIAVAADGSLREVIPGNGLITPRGMAFSPCGDLVVSNEDGGLMTLVSPAGRVSWFLEYNSFTSPVSFIAFDPDGALYATEGAPSFPERIIVVPPGGNQLASFADAAMPSGIARRQNGALIVANTSTGQVQSFNPDGSTSILAEGLRYPQALALDAAGNIYVVTGTGGQQILRANYMPSLGDTIVRVTPQGEVRTLVSLPRISGLAVSPQNELLALTGWDGGLVRITPDGRTTLILRGLGDVTDLKFDLAGHLYMSDTKLNGIVRIGGFPQGILSGVVTDASGAPVAGARVHVLSDDPIVIGQVLTTDAVGRFSLPAAPRTYSVTVTAEGYASVTLDGIQVDADQETVLEVKLKRQ